jgi:micrococcal nuclease
MSYIYEHVTLDRVVNGDTIDVVIDLGFSITVKKRLQLIDADMPEPWHEGGPEASSKLGELLGRGITMVSTRTRDSFGRWLSTIWVEGETRSVNELMREWLDMLE